MSKRGKKMEIVMLGSHVNNFNLFESLMDQYAILKACVERMNSKMEEQKIRFSSGILPFCLEENLRGLPGYKLKMVGDLADLRGGISAVIAKIGLRRKAQEHVKYLAECLEIGNSEDAGLEF